MGEQKAIYRMVRFNALSLTDRSVRNCGGWWPWPCIVVFLFITHRGGGEVLRFLSIDALQ
jgi:hypothetical protein